MAKDDGAQLLTVKDVARLYGVGTSTIYRAIQLREIAYLDIRGGYRFRREHVEEYLRSAEHKPARRRG